MKPPRDRKIMEMLLLDEAEPAEVAVYFNVTIDNLYIRLIPKMKNCLLKECLIMFEESIKN